MGYRIMSILMLIIVSLAFIWCVVRCIRNKKEINPNNMNFTRVGTFDSLVYG